MRFDVHFKVGKHEQWVEFVIERPLDDTYWKRHNAWAAYTTHPNRHKRKGKFGVIELPVTDNDPLLIGCLQHEIDHMVIDWFLCWKGATINRRNEERFTTLAGEIAQAFWKEYGKQVK